ncbi:MAG: leucine-rich repeat protein, partial [Clostridia bacterium]|nr:leucine-rich repeat protein [Clostridia bacterium]
DGVTTIGTAAFSCCSELTNVFIYNSFTTIGMNAFAYCEKLSKIIVGNKVTSIDSYAFDDCTNITDVYYTGSKDEWNTISIIEWGNEYLLNATIHFNYKQYIPGDINNDGVVSAEDEVYFSRYFAKWDGYTDTELSYDAADLDSDGNISNTDSVILSRHLAKWSGYIEIPISNKSQ